MRIYFNQNAGFKAVNGVVGSISADRKTMVVKSQTWDIKTRKNVSSDIKVIFAMPVDETYHEGENVSVVGYPKGGMISSDHIFKDEGGYGEEIITEMKNDKEEQVGYGFLAGKVLFSRVNDEKNADGSAKTKQDGSAKKRHFDIGVKCVNEKGEEMLHIVKVYDGNFTPAGKKTPLEKYRDIFAKHENEECRVFITTSALGEKDVYTHEKEYNGETQVTTYANHMGIKSADFVFTKVLEKEAAKEADNAPVAEQAQNYEPTAPEEAPVVNTGSDISRPPINEEDEYALGLE